MSAGAFENAGDGLLLECAGARFLASAFDQPAAAEDDHSPEATGLRVFLASTDTAPEVGGRNGSVRGWRLLARSPTEVTYARGEPPVLRGYVTLRLVEGTWQPAGFGSQCVTRPFREGLNMCRWGLDPGVPTAADTSAVHVIVNDSQCASGVGPDNRLREPEVTVTDESVTILFTTTTLTGMQTCPGHPAAKRVVELGEVLGSRFLWDGGIFPALPPCPIDQWGNIVGALQEFGD